MKVVVEAQSVTLRFGVSRVLSLCLFNGISDGVFASRGSATEEIEEKEGRT